MPKISFTLNDGVGEWTSVSDTDERALRMSFSPSHSGYIRMGSTVYTVKDGEVSIPLTAIDNGVYSPRLECDGGGFCLESFLKSDGCVKPLPTEEAVLRRLVRMCREATERIKLLEDDVTELKKKTEGHRIFN